MAPDGEKATAAAAPAGLEGGGGGTRGEEERVKLFAEVATEPELLAVLQELAVGDEVTIKITKASREGEEERVGEKATATDQDKLTNISQNYENDKKSRIASLKALAKAMKQEQALSSLEEHDYLDFLLESVGALVARTKHLNMKYNELVAENMELSNILQEEEAKAEAKAKAKAKGKWPAEF